MIVVTIAGAILYEVVRRRAQQRSSAV